MLLLLCLQLPDLVLKQRLSLECQLHILRHLQLSLLLTRLCHQLKALLPHNMKHHWLLQTCTLIVPTFLWSTVAWPTLHPPRAAPQLLLEPLHHSTRLRFHQALATRIYCLQRQTWLQPMAPQSSLVRLKWPLMLAPFSRYPPSPKLHQLQACLSVTCPMAMVAPSSLLAVSPACLGSMADHALSHLSSHTSCNSRSCISTCCSSSISSSSFHSRCLGASRRSQVRCHTALRQTLASHKVLA